MRRIYSNIAGLFKITVMERENEKEDYP